MTFKHKLSSRLALLKDRVVLASLAGLVTAAIMAVSWSVTAGSIIDTSSNGKRHYGHYKAGPNPGQYKVVATGSPGGVSDTAVVTVTVAPVSAVSVAPTAATILMGATTQLQ